MEIQQCKVKSTFPARIAPFSVPLGRMEAVQGLRKARSGADPGGGGGGGGYLATLSTAPPLPLDQPLLYEKYFVNIKHKSNLKIAKLFPLNVV